MANNMAKEIISIIKKKQSIRDIGKTDENRAQESWLLKINMAILANGGITKKKEMDLISIVMAKGTKAGG